MLDHLTVLLDDHDLHGARRGHLVAQLEDDLSAAVSLSFVFPDCYTLHAASTAGTDAERLATAIAAARKAYLAGT